MAWYRAGTVSVTNGSPTVTGAGTAYVANVSAGEGFVGPDGRTYEIAAVVSNTVLTLASNYLSASASGQSYWIAPTQSALAEATAALAEVTESYQAVRDGPGQGLFVDGSAAAPGVRFANDQDTGIFRPSPNSFAIAAAGTERLRVTDQGNVGIGTATPSVRLQADAADPGQGIVASLRNATGTTGCQLHFAQSGVADWSIGQPPGAAGFAVYKDRNTAVAGAELMRLDNNGNLLVGKTSASNHFIYRNVSGDEGLRVLQVGGQGFSTDFFGVGTGNYNVANAAMKIPRDSLTARSVNAGGTINASGADYAEYVTKADGCSDIGKGDVCGVDRDGKLTRTWADALHFVVKSTAPNLVGGDSWAQHIGLRPEPPAPLRPAPLAPVAPEPFAQSAPVQGKEESEHDFAARHYLWATAKVQAEEALADHEAALAAHPAALALWHAEKAAHDEAVAAHEVTKAEWEDALEEARQKVDRIAFCGQVPVNVDAGVLADCEDALEDGEPIYLVAVANGGGIGCAAMRESAMTLPAYMRRLGVVWRIEDDRPIIDVQHG